MLELLRRNTILTEGLWFVPEGRSFVSQRRGLRRNKRDETVPELRARRPQCDTSARGATMFQQLSDPDSSTYIDLLADDDTREAVQET